MASSAIQHIIRGLFGAIHDGGHIAQIDGLVIEHPDDHGADVVLVSTGLADRRRLALDVARAAKEADVFLTEIKAAAVDVVAEAAAAAGRELVFCDNEPVAGDGDLGALVDELERLAVARFAARSGAAGRADGGSGGEV